MNTHIEFHTASSVDLDNIEEVAIVLLVMDAFVTYMGILYHEHILYQQLNT